MASMTVDESKAREIAEAFKSFAEMARHFRSHDACAVVFFRWDDVIEVRDLRAAEKLRAELLEMIVRGEGGP